MRLLDSEKVIMDRREALKKLGVGGAVAAGASLVLSSNPVAAAGSGPPGLPPNPRPSVIYSNASNTITITLTVPNCTDGSPPTTQYLWSNPTGTLATGNQTVTISGSSMNASVTLLRTGHPNASKNAWSNGDAFSVQVSVTLTCGTTSRTDAYTVSGTIGSPATIT